MALAGTEIVHAMEYWWPCWWDGERVSSWLCY